MSLKFSSVCLSKFFILQCLCISFQGLPIPDLAHKTRSFDFHRPPFFCPFFFYSNKSNFDWLEFSYIQFFLTRGGGTLNKVLY